MMYNLVFQEIDMDVDICYEIVTKGKHIYKRLTAL